MLPFYMFRCVDLDEQFNGKEAEASFLNVKTKSEKSKIRFYQYFGLFPETIFKVYKNYVFVCFISVLCVCYSYYGEYYESMKVKKSMKAKL